jgi:hypothetical protein
MKKNDFETDGEIFSKVDYRHEEQETREIFSN